MTATRQPRVRPPAVWLVVGAAALMTLGVLVAHLSLWLRAPEARR